MSGADLDSIVGMEWTRTAAKFSVTPRFSHASCAVGKTIYIIGGQRKGYLADVWAWDCAGDEWMGYTPAGKAPAARVQSAAVFSGKELLLFGGYVENVAEENDLHALDVLHAEREFTWTQPQVTGALPPKRYGHTATMVGARMVVIAGQDSAAQLSDVWLLDTATYAWAEVHASGDVFIPRALHTATHVRDVGVVVLGGFNRKLRNLSQAHVLELSEGADAAAWRLCTDADPARAFRGRAQHRAVAQAAHVIVFGGYDGVRAGGRCRVACGARRACASGRGGRALLVAPAERVPRAAGGARQA